MTSLKNLIKFGISASTPGLTDTNESSKPHPTPWSSPLPGFGESWESVFHPQSSPLVFGHLE